MTPEGNYSPVEKGGKNCFFLPAFLDRPKEAEYG